MCDAYGGRQMIIPPEDRERFEHLLRMLELRKPGNMRDMAVLLYELGFAAHQRDAR